MKTLCGITVVVLVLLLGGAAAPAARDRDQRDGNELREACRDDIRLEEAGWRGSSQVSYNAGYCTGYVFGLFELHEGAIRMSLQPLRPLFCLPTEAGRIEQLVRVVAHYLEAHPERLHLLQRDL